MKQRNKFLLSIVMDLSKIHDAYVRSDNFSAGFELGALLTRVVNSINQDEREEDDEEVQDEECDEECEESSEEEDESVRHESEDKEQSYYLQFLREQKNRIETEKSFQELLIKNKKLEETNQSINETKRCIFELQDLLMRLVKFKKVSKQEVDNVLNILRNTGVDKSDINIICKGLIK